MPIFPLWSGILLGDLKRYAVDLAVTLPSHKDICQTRDTNCHAENWFWIVKNFILCRKHNLRPAEFITSMYTSLKGQYREYILNNSLPQDVLIRPRRSSKDVSFAVERWAKRSAKRGKRTSCYFSAPQEMPMSKRKHSTEPQKDTVKKVISVIKIYYN